MLTLYIYSEHKWKCFIKHLNISLLVIYQYSRFCIPEYDYSLLSPTVGEQSFLADTVLTVRSAQKPCFKKHVIFLLIRHFTNYDIVQCSGFLNQFWPPIVPCYSTEDAVRIVNSFITIPITRNYNHPQLFLTLLRVYTIIILTRS
jgi:hypothetical protein